MTSPQKWPFPHLPPSPVTVKTMEVTVFVDLPPSLPWWRHYWTAPDRRIDIKVYLSVVAVVHGPSRMFTHADTSFLTGTLHVVQQDQRRLEVKIRLVVFPAVILPIQITRHVTHHICGSIVKRIITNRSPAAVVLDLHMSLSVRDVPIFDHVRVRESNRPASLRRHGFTEQPVSQKAFMTLTCEGAYQDVKKQLSRELLGTLCFIF